MASNRFTMGAAAMACGTASVNDSIEEWEASLRRVTPWHPTESMSEDWAFERPALASLDETLHAERLRLRLRERFPDTEARCVPPWCVGAD
jgi:hypothetical protein